MHTPLCHHATGEPWEYARKAVESGLSEIGFSEHSPMQRDDFDDWHMYLHDLDNYLDKVELARARYPELIIRIGLEVDYIPGHESWIEHLASLHQWDYFIGSVHYITDEWDFDNPKKMDQWHASDPWQVWKTYFERLTMAAGSGLFQTIGHADLCKKFAIYPPAHLDTRELYVPFLEAVRDHDIAIEINTAGRYKDCREWYPHPDILREAAAMKIPLSFASDAHAPDEVARDFEMALPLVRECGFTHFCAFEQRRRSLIPFEEL